MSSSTKPRIAVIGLGSMGYGMASALKRAGFEITGCDVSAETLKRFVSEGGQGRQDHARGSGESADIVVSVVVNAAQTEAILFGKDGVAETLVKGRRVHFFRDHGPGRRKAACKTT